MSEFSIGLIVTMIFSIVAYREWLPLPEAHTGTVVALSSLFIFLCGGVAALSYIVVAVVRLFQKRWLAAGTAFLIPVVCAAMFFLLPERKLVETRSDFHQNRTQYLSKVADNRYNEFYPCHRRWAIVFDPAGNPEAYPGDSVRIGACEDAGSMEMELEKNWYICHLYIDFP